MRSCASLLHDIQEDMGLTKRELSKAANLSRRDPVYDKLPVLRERLSKNERMQAKLDSLSDKQKQYNLAYWYLEEFLKPKYARSVYFAHQDFKELISFAYDKALEIIQLNTFVIKTIDDPLSVFPADSDDEYDISEEDMPAFIRYCKDHPLIGVEDILRRRDRFRDHKEKRRKRLYSHKRMRMYDPLFAMTDIDEKEMLRNLKRISKENEERISQFKDLLDSLVVDESIGAEAMRQFDKQTKTLMNQHQKRMKDFMRQAGLKETHIEIDLVDSLALYGSS